MSSNLISVIIPIYNTEKYLKKCIESIINQTYSNIEILLINDGSTDKSLEICRKYMSIDNRIKVIDKKNTGVSDTRNVGVKNSKGDFIVFIDSDDYIEKTMFEKMIDVILHEQVDVVRCNVNIYEKKGNFHNEKFYELSNKKIDHNEILNNIYRFVTFNKNINCYMSLLMIKKEKIIYFNDKLTFMEDTEFYIRLLLNINSMFFLDENLYNYCYNDISSSKNINNSINNIYGIIDSTNVIKKSLNNYNILSIQLLKEMNLSIYLLIFTKLNIFYKNNFIKCFLETKKLFNDEKIRRIIFNINFKKLSFTKKIEYLLIKVHFYFLLTILLKFILFIK